ncbi:DUF2934 domain-containing protein [Sinorhizobium fredii]|uniref:DUF2934 domain-containing protein n=1 Tax=Rhizobium fredii TaxID=380 RepID=UPI002351C1ED|nr:DUF2934 domain-containing protein [Sinorhizobium fredii]
MQRYSRAQLCPLGWHGIAFSRRRDDSGTSNKEKKRRTLVERVRRRAYEIWEREGRLDGDHERHWHQAAKELESQAGVGAAASDRSGNVSVRSKKSRQ